MSSNSKHEYDNSSYNSEEESEYGEDTPREAGVSSDDADELLYKEAMTKGLSHRGEEWIKDYIDSVYEKEITDKIIQILYTLVSYSCRKDLEDLVRHLIQVSDSDVQTKNLKSILHNLQSTMDCD